MLKRGRASAFAGLDAANFCERTEDAETRLRLMEFLPMSVGVRHLENAPNCGRTITSTRKHSSLLRRIWRTPILLPRAAP